MSEVSVDDFVAHSPARVWEASVTSPLASRWLPFEGFAPAIGHRFAARGPTGTVPCEVLDLDEPRRMVIAWNDPEMPSTVELTLRGEAGGTRVRLVHRGTAPTRRPPLQIMWSEAVGQGLGTALAPRRPGAWGYAVPAAVVLPVLAAGVLLGLWTNRPGTVASPRERRGEPTEGAPAVVAPSRPAAAARPPFTLGAVHVLAPGPWSESGHAQDPTWSVDGAHLAYEVSPVSDGDADLWVAAVGPSGPTGRTRLGLPGARGPGRVGNAAWLWEGYVVFEGRSAGGAARLFYRAADGGAVSELIDPRSMPGGTTFPVVSPDGQTLVFVSEPGGLRSLDTRRATRSGELTQSPHTEWFPRFTRDGRAVVFTRVHQGDADLLQVGLEGGTETRVAGGPGDQTRPNPAAGGWVVFFERARGQEHWSVVAVRGAERRVLGEEVRLPHRAPPALDPDGRLAAWAWEDPARSDVIAVAPVDGGPIRELPMPGVACGEPALTWQGDRLLLAASCLTDVGAGWRSLVVAEVETLP